MRAHRNAAVAGPGYYAIIKFYSDRDASRAQRACNGQRLFQKSPLKVSKATDEPFPALSTATSNSRVESQKIFFVLSDVPCAFHQRLANFLLHALQS